MFTDSPDSEVDLSDYESCWSEEPASVDSYCRMFAGRRLESNSNPPEDRVLLLLGKTVSGKTTLSKLLCGEKLRIEERCGQFLISDFKGKIGQDGISCTDEPNLAILTINTQQNEKVLICDCPGFGDTAGVQWEVQQQRRMRRAVARKHVKGVLVTEYASTVVGTCVDSFVSLLQYAVELLFNQSTDHAAVYLVINKVPSIPRRINGCWVLKEDDEVKAEVRDFLRSVAASLQDETRAERLAMEPSLRARCAELAVALAAEDPCRLEVLRVPDMAGPVEDCELLQQGRRAVLDMILCDEPWIPAGRMGVSLRVRQQLTIEAKQILEDLSARLEEMRTAAKDFVKADMEHQTEHDALELLQKDVDWDWVPEVVQGQKEVEKLLSDLRDLEDDIEEEVVVIAESQVEKYKQDLDGYVNRWRSFLKMFIALQEILWSYKFQAVPLYFDWGKREFRPAKMPRVPVLDRHNVLDFLKSLAEFIDTPLDFFEPSFDLEDHMLNRLNGLLAESMGHWNNTMVTSEGDDVVVQGVCLTLSRVLPLLRNEAAPPRRVTLVARDTLFIDCSLVAVGQCLKLAVVAPRWHVEPADDGEPHVINLNGDEAEQEHNGPALCGSDAVGDREDTPVAEGATRGRLPPGRAGGCGRNGANGKPGGPAGAFFGVGTEFINGHLLQVSVCGGKGGDGQEGGHGGTGEDGEHAHPAFLGESYDYAYGSVSSWTFVLYSCRTAEFFGAPGGCGGDGGDGGTGGPGGPAGDVLIVGLPFTIASGYEKIQVHCENGPRGKDGLGGSGGAGGKNGMNYTGNLHFLTVLPVNTTYSKTPPQKVRAFQGSDGRSGGLGGEPPRGHEQQSCTRFAAAEKESVIKTFVQTVKNLQPEYPVPSRAELAESLAASLEGGKIPIQHHSHSYR